MTNLRAPPGHLSVVVNGQQFKVDPDGLLRNLVGDLAAIMMGHDPAFQVVSDEAAQASKEAFLGGGQLAAEAPSDGDDPADLGRNELFAKLRGMGVVVMQTLATEVVRDMLVAELKKKADPAAAAAAAKTAAANDAEVAAKKAAQSSPTKPPGGGPAA